MTQLEQLKKGDYIYLSSRVCMTKDLGIHGNCFGGVLLSFLDENSAVFAAEICDDPHVVTRNISNVDFVAPVKVGNIIKIYGKIKRFGTTSMTLEMEIRKHNVHTEGESTAVRAELTFVKIDDEGTPIPISDRIKIKFGFLRAEDVYKREMKNEGETI